MIKQATRRKRSDLVLCPCCGGPGTPLVRSKDFNRGTSEREFEYFQCGLCGLVFMDSIPEDLAPFYAGGYARIPETLAELRAVATEERYRLEPVLRYKQRGKLLEIGPWRGVFCVNARDAGFTVSAIEMDGGCVEFLRGVVGVDAVQSMDPAAAMAGMTERFEVIALWHSLEHLRAPWKVIGAAAARLAPGGVLVLALPNIESFEFEVLKERWRHLDAPRHLHFYAPEPLTAVCAEHGLRLLELRTHDRLSELMARETWVEWAKRWFGTSRNAIRITNVVAAWAKAGERRRRHSGSGMTAVFQLPHDAP